MDYTTREYHSVYARTSLFLQICVSDIVIIAIACLFSSMRVGAYIAFLFNILWGAFRITINRNLRGPSPLRECPLVIVLIVLCLVSMLTGVHCFLDTFSYRIPQMQFWLQNGTPYSVPFVDMRINQMPHVWSFIEAPLLVVFGYKGLPIPNLISYFLFAEMLCLLLKDITHSAFHTTLIVTIFCSAPVLITQAPSNDNVMTCITFLLSTVFFCKKVPLSTWDIAKSALCLSLCCGIKPQYTTLAPIWIYWFFTCQSRPWKIFKFKILFLLLPIIILCSPVPTLLSNIVINGSFLHPQNTATTGVSNVNCNTLCDTALTESNPTKISHTNKVLYSNIALTQQIFDFPLNPFYSKFNASISKLTKRIPFSKKIGLDKLNFRPITIAENASWGFFSGISLLIGIVIGIRNTKKSKSKPLIYLAIASIVAMEVAIYITTPGTLGRSFFGFLIGLIPISAIGLSKIKSSILQVISLVCFIFGLAIIFLNPAMPLFPAHLIANHIPKHKADQVVQFMKYSKRHSIKEKITSILAQKHVNKLYVNIGAGEPIADIWEIEGIKNGRGVVIPTNIIHNADAPLIIKRSIITSPAIFEEGTQSIAQFEHTSYMQKGPELWYILQSSDHQLLPME